MSEEQLTSIDTRLMSVETKVGDLDHKVGGLDDKFNDLDAKFDGLDNRFNELDTKFDGLSTQFHDLSHQMLVLHEDTIDKIKALAPDFGPVRRDFAEADTKLREEIDQRLVPLEAFARKFGKSSPS